MNIFKKVSSTWARKTTADKSPNVARRPFFYRSGTVVDEEGSMRVAAFNRGIIYISTQIAKLPWDVKDRNNNIVENPISKLINLKPNPEMNAFFWRLVMVQQAIVQGNAYAEIERDGLGRAIALWPLDSRGMGVVRTSSGQLVYQYSDPSGGTVFLNPRDVFHLRNFHTMDGLVGQGVVAFGRDVLGIQIAADKMASGIFFNSGIPSGVLEHPGKLSDEAYARLKKSWDEQQGGRKSGSTSILEEGLKYTSINVQPDVLQFLESRQFGVLEIARFLGLPPTKLFDTAASTYSNVEQSNLEVATDTLDAWAANLEMEADVKLLNDRYDGKFTDIDLYSIFRGDMKTRSDYFKAMMSVAAMTPNQIRAREGMPGYGPKGDNYYVATNNFTPVDRMDEIIDADIKQKTKPASAPQTPKKTEQEQALEEAALKILTEQK